jgi:hypothetical protein
MKLTRPPAWPRRRSASAWQEARRAFAPKVTHLRLASTTAKIAAAAAVRRISRFDVSRSSEALDGLDRRGPRDGASDVVVDELHEIARSWQRLRRARCTRSISASLLRSRG